MNKKSGSDDFEWWLRSPSFHESFIENLFIISLRMYLLVNISFMFSFSIFMVNLPTPVGTY